MQDNMVTLHIDSEAQMVELGNHLVATFPDTGLVMTLQGDLGAGKTTLVRAVLRALGIRGHVRSPTYTLVEPYDLGPRQAYHLDLYRLGDPQELEFLGIRDLDPSADLVFIEWPEKGEPLLPQADIAAALTVAPDGGRSIQLLAHTARGAAIVAQR